MDYSFPEGAHHVHVRCGSGTDFEEWATTMERLFADPRFAPGVHFLGDQRARSAAPGRDELLRMVEFFARHASRLAGRRCAVVAAPGAGFGMARMAEAHAEGAPFELRAFEDLDSAVAWVEAG